MTAAADAFADEPVTERVERLMHRCDDDKLVRYAFEVTVDESDCLILSCPRCGADVMVCDAWEISNSRHQLSPTHFEKLGGIRP